MRDDAYPDALPAQYQLHWYLLERVLGQGGFGITYLARDANLDQKVAIKEYLPVDVATRRADATVRARSDDQADRYRWGLDRFIREARTLARFDHPNIVRVLSVFEQHGTAYMVMRFEEGENFAALLDRKRTLPEADLMRVLLPVLEGLELVHNAGFIHRDIKPDNIHIRDDGTPVLLDFGSARLALGQSRTMTILVAPGYAPFEQYYSSGDDQGPWTDIYSLGATCYRAIAGVPPMDAITRSKGILGSAREILVPTAAVGAGRYSERLLRAVDHALAFDEKDRPQSIAEWRAELIDSGAPARTSAPRGSEPKAPARPATAPERPAPAAPAQAPAARAAPNSPPPSPPPAKSPVLRSASIAIGLLVAALLGGGIGAYLVLHGSGRPPATQSEDARAKAEAERQAQAAATARAEQEAARAKAEAERIAREKARAEEEAARAKAEAERIAREKAAAEKARAEAAARAQAEAERVAREKAAAERIAREKAAAERIAREKAAAERIAREKAAAEQTRAEAAARAKAQAEARAAQSAAARDAKAQPQIASNAPRNDADAFTYYRDLAHGGNATAAYKLGELYEAGRGVAASNNWAYLWYSVAERRGVQAAKSKKETAMSKLQPAEIEQIDRQVQALVGSAK
ncbi:MAG: protein kinase [Betaproteobacteria bacterium]|nr:protein kinase [Betaproteobacteria bacterium]